MIYIYLLCKKPVYDPFIFTIYALYFLMLFKIYKHYKIDSTWFRHFKCIVY